MYFGDFINEEFSDYLNRYCTGIVLLKDDIQKITVNYGLSEAFSNHACRFYIEIGLIDYKSFSEEKKKLVNEYFYNNSNETGCGFVSFIYNRQHGDFDVEIVQSFISHYLYAKNLFEGFIRAIVSQNCVVEVASLKEEPFFNYIESFIREVGYSSKQAKFSRRYKEIKNRDFGYDCFYHKILLKAEYAGKEPIENGVTDKELFDAGGGEIKELRRFVLDEQIPFVITSYGNVIDEIYINAKVLREKVKTYVPKYTYSDICPESILLFLERRAKKAEEKKALFDRKCQETGIQTGDYICAEISYDISADQCMGVVKEMHLDYHNEIEFSYNVLKMDLTESKRALKRVSIAGIQYILPQDVVVRELQTGNLKTKYQLGALFKSEGIKNPFFKRKKKKKS